MSRNNKNPTNRLVLSFVAGGLLIMGFALGKSVIDLTNSSEHVIDLATDDGIESGFLPIYVGHSEASDSHMGANDEAKGLTDQTILALGLPEKNEQQTTSGPGFVPNRLVIGAIDLEAEIEPVEYAQYEYQGEIFQQWLAPEQRAVGWHYTSAGLGVPGNTVLNGHHNIRGEVFRDLYKIRVGDQLTIYSGDQSFVYAVVYADVLPERNQTLEVRLDNAKWILPTEDERVTLISCWPYESNTHRVVVVAVPVRTDNPS